MLSWQSQYELAQTLTSDLEAVNLDALKVLIGAGQRRLDAILGVYYTETSRTFTTITDAITGTSNMSYKIPENFRDFVSLYVTVDSNRYAAELIQDENMWQDMISGTTGSTDDCLEFCFIRRDRVELYPIPAAAHTATLVYHAFTKPLSHDDYNTGTILTLANASMNVVGNTPAWTSSMVGRSLKINDDGEWYKIAAVPTAATITLDSPYQGISISSGTSTYTIGEFPATPPETHELPVFYAVWKYGLFRKDVQLAREFERMWKEGVAESQRNWSNINSSPLIYENKQPRVNPNDYPSNMT
jgi:hypothetical protein